MVLFELSSDLSYIVLGLVVGVINVPISYLLSKITKILVFLIPSLFFVLTLFFVITAISAEELGKLFLIIYSVLAGIIFVATFISSLIIYLIIRKKDRKKFNGES